VTPELLHRIGSALYGARWHSDLARDLDMSDRHMRRLANGSVPIHDGIRADLLRLCEARAAELGSLLPLLRP
jgi:hypothetical protein